MPRWFKITLAGLGITALCLGAVYAYGVWSFRNTDWNIPVYKESSVRDPIMPDLSYPKCPPRKYQLTNC